MNHASISHFNCLPVYSGKKSIDGFHTKILSSLESLLTWSIANFSHPKAIHFVIEEPMSDHLDRLGEFLTRWQIKRAGFNQNSKPDPLYLYAIERKPRKLSTHAHLMVILDDCNFHDLMSLRDQLTRISNNKSVSLLSRREENLSLKYDRLTGEVKLKRNGNPVRQGSRHFHLVRSEFSDCFERFSYLAKAFSKHAIPEWSCSRLKKRMISPVDKATVH